MEAAGRRRRAWLYLVDVAQSRGHLRRMRKRRGLKNRAESGRGQGPRSLGLRRMLGPPPPPPPPPQLASFSAALRRRASCQRRSRAPIRRGPAACVCHGEGVFWAVTLLSPAARGDSTAMVGPFAPQHIYAISRSPMPGRVLHVLRRCSTDCSLFPHCLPGSSSHPALPRRS